MKKPIWFVIGWDITCIKTNMYVMILGIGKTLYQIVMVFNTEAHTKVDTNVDTPVYLYIPAQHYTYLSLVFSAIINKAIMFNFSLYKKLS